MNREQLATHRELEYLRAVGRAAGRVPKRHRRRLPKTTIANLRARIVQRREKLREVQP